MRRFPIEERERELMTYAEFRRSYDEKLEHIHQSGRPSESMHRLNHQRLTRWERSYTPSQEVREALASLPPQHWVVLTEDWCADVAQNLPLIAKWVEYAPQIKLSILQRDENLDLMDLVLTNGTRSIPKLVALNDKNEIDFEWGPRPSSIQGLFYHLRERGVPKEEIMPQIHKEYARNKGKALEQDLLDLLLVKVDA